MMALYLIEVPQYPLLTTLMKNSSRALTPAQCFVFSRLVLIKITSFLSSLFYQVGWVNED